jgi:hypothetical protein
VQASAAVRARRSMFSFIHNFNNHFFKWAIVPGWTINEFRALANARTRKDIFHNHCIKQQQ